jgi:hypothetical protein
MRFSRRTRIVVGVFFFTAIGLLWYVQWSESPRWAFWALIALSAALASFEALVRKVLIPRGVSSSIRCCSNWCLPRW